MRRVVAYVVWVLTITTLVLCAIAGVWSATGNGLLAGPGVCLMWLLSDLAWSGWRKERTA